MSVSQQKTKFDFETAIRLYIDGVGRKYIPYWAPSLRDSAYCRLKIEFSLYEIDLRKMLFIECIKHKQQLKITLSTLLISIDPKRFLQSRSQYHYFKSPNGGKARISENDSFFCRQFLFLKNFKI